MAEIAELTNYLRGFAASRQWEQYHTSSNLAKSISIEANELLEMLQWREDFVEDPAPEMADVLIYLLMLADLQGIDLAAATRAKIASNGQRYPVEKCRGNCKKAEEL
jgi:dCTP diphosphatase